MPHEQITIEIKTRQPRNKGKFLPYVNGKITMTPTVIPKHLVGQILQFLINNNATK